MDISANNVSYWLGNKLTPEEVRVLLRVKRDRQPFFQDRFEIAHLIALECLEADVEKCTLAITKKGLEGLEFFKDKLTKLSDL